MSPQTKNNRDCYLYKSKHAWLISAVHRAEAYKHINIIAVIMP